MVTRAGRKPTLQIAPFYRNWRDQDGRAIPTTSPEDSNPNTELANALRTPALNTTIDQPGLLNTLANAARTGWRNEVLPLINNPALNQRHTIRGLGNGRWAKGGSAPRDGDQIGFDYWEKVQINPSAIALGNIVSDTVSNVVIKNTFRRDNKTLNSIDNNAGAGITVEGPATPANLPSLFDRTYAVTVSTSGPPNINGSIDFITNAGTLSVTVTGTRIIIFPYAPQSNIKETLKWVTDVLKAADGTEQRHALRKNPRQSLAYEIRADSYVEINSIRNLFIDWTTRVFGVPVWFYEQALNADVAVNDLTIFLRPGALENSDFRAGGLAMIFQEFEDGTFQLDALQIASIQNSAASPESTANSITFATAVQNNYDGATTTVVPVVACVLADGAKAGTNQGGNSVNYSMDFDALDNETSVPGVDVAGYNTLEDGNGNELLILEDRNFLLSGGLSESFQQVAQRIDFKVGRFQQLTQEKKARRVTPFTWRVESASEEWRIRALLYFLRGQLRDVWVPTWREDFIPVAPIGVSATNFDVENSGFAKYVAGALPWAALRLLDVNGNTTYHRITDATEVDDTTERIFITPATTLALTVAEVARIDLMILARQATDNVTLTHSWVDAESDVLDTTIETSFVGDVQ